MVRRQIAGQSSRGKVGMKERDLRRGRTMRTNLKHNEVQLMAPPQMWGKHRGAGLGAEEGKQDRPEA